MSQSDEAQRAMDLPWWREHVAYAVDQRRKMRRGYVVAMTLLLLGVTSSTLLAAQVSWWIIIPVVAFATALFATDIREWKKSETNYSRSLRIRRAGLAEAAKNEATTPVERREVR
jgi:phosphate/sulfate permease